MLNARGKRSLVESFKMPSHTQVTCCSLLLVITTTLTLGAPSPSPPPPPTQPHMKFQAPFNYHHHHLQHNQQQRTQPTVMNPISVHPHAHNTHQQPVQRPHNLGARLPVVAQQQQQSNQTNQRQQRVLAMCSVPDELRPYSRCLNHQEHELKLAARSEFQSRLVETSSDLRQLLANYLLEFRSLSLGLVLVARNDTLVRLRQLAGPTPAQHDAIQLATRRLFESMYSHLLTYPQVAYNADPDLLLRPSGNTVRVGTTVGDFQQELNDYLRRLQLIHLKRALEEFAQPTVELDLDCLDRNLQSSPTLIDVIFDELTTSETRDSWRSIKAQQVRLSQALRQSIEFARTLLSSLNLASEMFANLTQRPDDWMPSDSCHLALTRMSMCQECHTLVGGGVGVSSSVGGNHHYLGAPPCENYCLNVARGCMNDLYELNRFWADHVSALGRFKANMIQTNNLENVMSSLTVNLVDNLVGKLQQLQYNSATAELDQLPASSGLIKRCPRNHQAGAQNSGGSASGLAGFFKRAAMAADLLQLPRAIPGRPASKMLPPTQQRPAEVQMSEAALRARQSPAMSLFNRLDGLVLQLQETRDFFADWPQQMCHRIRAHRDAQAGVPAGPPHTSLTRRINSTECWNGRDFSGYSKPLAPFGLPISAGHPEVATLGAQTISPLVLNLVARLKEIGTQLARKSIRTSIDLLSLTSSRVLDSTASKNAKSALGPLAAARVSEDNERSSASLTISNNDQQQQADEQDHEVAASRLVQTLAAATSQQQQQPAKQQPTNEDLDVAPDGEAAESEGDHEPSGALDEQDEPLGDELDNAAATGSADELAPLEGGEGDDMPCMLADCLDLLSSTSTSSSGGAGEQEPQQLEDSRAPPPAPVKPVVIVPTYPSYPNEIFYTQPELTYTYPPPPPPPSTSDNNNNINNQNYQVAVGSGASSSSLHAPLELLAGSLLLCLALCLCYACRRPAAHRLANVRVAGQLGAK